MNKGIKIVAGIIAVSAVLLLTATLSVDGLVKNEIEDSGSEMLQTELEIDDLDISLFGGTGEIEELTIENPEGFSDEEAITFDQIDMKVNLQSLMSDRVIVEELVIESPYLLVEQLGSDINLKELSDRLSNTGSEDSEKTVVINELRIKNTNIRLVTEAEGSNSETTLDEIVLRDIGKENSNTLKETLAQVLEPVMQQAVQKAIQDGIMDKVEDTVNDIIGG